MKLMRPVAMLCALGVTLGGVTALAVTQGSKEDPIITLSYLESVLRPKLEEEVDAAVKEGEAAIAERLDAAVEEAKGELDKALSAGTVYKSRQLARGESLTPGAGREIYVDAGSLTALGRLSDLTAGKSVSSGASLTVGHVYLTLSDDGGCKASGSATVLVR